jgi:hypothetical protein
MPVVEFLDWIDAWQRSSSKMDTLLVPGLTTCLGKVSLRSWEIPRLEHRHHSSVMPAIDLGQM